MIISSTSSSSIFAETDLLSLESKYVRIRQHIIAGRGGGHPCLPLMWFTWTCLRGGQKQAMDEEESRIFGVDPVRMAQYRNGSRDEVLRTPEHVREHMFANTEHFVFHVIDEAATVIQSIVRQRIANENGAI